MSVLMEVVLSQVYEGQQTVNRWNYVGSGTPAAVTMSFALISALGAIYDGAYPTDSLLFKLHSLQSNAVTFEGVSARNIYSAVDFYETVFVPALTGANTGEAGSPALAYGFRTNRIRTDVARGMKRFAGVTESNMGAGGSVDVTGSGFTDLIAKMNEVLTYDDEGNTLTFAPAVFGKEKYEVEVGGVPTGRFAYRYFGTQSEQEDHIAQGIAWQAYDKVRTQVTRQFGRGR